MNLARAITNSHAPCPKCHMPMRYDAPGATYIHEREALDELDNGYQCAAEYEKHVRKPATCWKCGQPSCWLVGEKSVVLGENAVCPFCAQIIGGMAFDAD